MCIFYIVQLKLRITSLVILIKHSISKLLPTLKFKSGENQDGGVGRHTAPPSTTRTDRESNNKGDQHQENRK